MHVTDLPVLANHVVECRLKRCLPLGRFLLLMERFAFAALHTFTVLQRKRDEPPDELLGDAMPLVAIGSTRTHARTHITILFNNIPTFACMLVRKPKCWLFVSTHHKAHKNADGAPPNQSLPTSTRTREYLAYTVPVPTYLHEPTRTHTCLLVIVPTSTYLLVLTPAYIYLLETTYMYPPTVGVITRSRSTTSKYFSKSAQSFLLPAAGIILGRNKKVKTDRTNERTNERTKEKERKELERKGRKTGKKGKKEIKKEREKERG